MDFKEEDYYEFLKQKQEKQEYLKRYGYSEKVKLDKIIDLLYNILEVIKNERK